LWWASQNRCVEPEIAPDENTLFDRISGRLRLKTLCLRVGERRATADRFMPVLQGWHPVGYLHCVRH